MTKKRYHDEKGANAPQEETTTMMVEAHCRLLAWEQLLKFGQYELPQAIEFLRVGKLVMVSNETVVVEFTKKQAIARSRVEKFLPLLNHGLSRINGRDVLIKIIEAEA